MRCVLIVRDVLLLFVVVVFSCELYVFSVCIFFLSGLYFISISIMFP